MMSSLKQQTFSGVLWSAIERFSVQGIQFALSLIIARQLLPSDYGLIAMLSIFLAIAQCFVDSGFSNALIQKQDRTQTDFSTVFYFNIAIGVLVYLLLLLCAPIIASFYKQPLLEDIIIWIGLNVVINSFVVVQRAILSIKLNFRKQALASLLAVIVSGVVALYMALNGFGVWTLVVQGLLNAFVNALVLWLVSKWKPSLVFSLNSFRKLFSFGSKLLAGGLLHTIYSNLYTLIVGKVFSTRELGLYSKASALADFPSTNSSEILNRVFYPVLCKLQDNDEILTVKFYQFIRLTAFVVFPMMIGLAMIAEPLIRLILTDKWCGIVQYMQILCFAYMWSPIMKMSWNLLNVKHRTDLSLKSEIVKKITAFVILFATIPWGIKMMCYGRILYSLADLFIILCFTRKVLPNVTIHQHVKNLFPIFFQTLLMGGIVYIWILCFENTLIQLVGGVFVGGISYVLTSLILNKKEIDLITSLLNIRIETKHIDTAN